MFDVGGRRPERVDKGGQFLLHVDDVGGVEEREVDRSGVDGWMDGERKERAMRIRSVSMRH